MIETEIPAGSLQQLACESHNGDITITGAATDTITLRVEMSVRGITQAEADSNLHLLELGRELVGDRLRLFGKYPPNALDNRSPTFTFTLTAPARLVLQLESHNGDLVARKVDGTVAAVTHNGRIQAELASSAVRLKTHNGDVQVQIDGQGPLDGTVESHNGGVELTFDGGRATAIVASTHNGHITSNGPVRVVASGMGSVQGGPPGSMLQAQVGDGGGKLGITTHNGDITLR